MLIALHLAAALAVQAPPAPPSSPSGPDVRREVRVITLGGGEGGPGRMDKDGDGFVTREEFTAPMGDAFAGLDKDGDGRVSTEEFKSGHGEDDQVLILGGRDGGPGMRRFEMRMPGGGDHETMILRHGGPGHDGPAGGPHQRRVEIHLMGGPGAAALDKNGDGVLSEDEFLAPLRDAFRSMDVNSSGTLEAGERAGGDNVHVIKRRETPAAD